MASANHVRPPVPLPKALIYVIRPFQQFLATESASGILLLVATAVALGWANSRYAAGYHHLLEQPITMTVGPRGISWPLHHWINDGLMALFFLLVGLEIKRELVIGELSSFGSAILPLVAAAGGMAVPALVFTAFNHSSAGARGWGIPTATDIAFAVGCITVLKGRVPHSLVVFLTALAIFDDLGAILVIALFYGGTLDVAALLAAVGITAALLAMNVFGVKRPLPYVGLGVLLWLAILQSGIHATMAGVILGLCIPARAQRPPEEVTAELEGAIARIKEGGTVGLAANVEAVERRLEEIQAPLGRIAHGLQFPVAFVIVPVFAVANAGVDLSDLTFADFASPVSLGVALGLFFGKQVGIFLATTLAVKLKLSPLPANARWAQVYGVAILGGIGFTMSLFISALAFPAEGRLNEQAKIGILLGSIVSALVGLVVLRLVKPVQQPEAAPAP